MVNLRYDSAKALQLNSVGHRRSRRKCRFPALTTSGRRDRIVRARRQRAEAPENIAVDRPTRTRRAPVRVRTLDSKRRVMEARLSPELDTALSCVRYELLRMHRAEKGLDLPTSHHSTRSLSSPERLEEDESEWLSTDGDAIPVLDSVETWRACAYNLHSKHSLPYFSELFTQLQIHEEWMMKLPWYCEAHRTPHGHDVLDDVLSSTEPEDDTAPDNEYLTCICFEAVYLPAPGETGENSDAVQCSSCYARFHHQCAAKFKYCPFCDPMFWNGSIQSSRTRTWHFYSLKTLLQNAPCVSRKYSEAHEELEIIVHQTDRLCTVIQRFLSLTVPHEVRENEIKQMRHYMRKLHKLQFIVSHDPKTSFALELCHLYTSSCLILEPGPKFQFGTDFDEVWNDGTLCVCRGQLPEMHGVEPVHCVNCRRRVTDSCPLCCLREGIDYPWAEIRVRHPEIVDDKTFVDMKACSATCSLELLTMELEPPVRPTIFIDLVLYSPGVKAEPELPSS